MPIYLGGYALTGHGFKCRGFRDREGLLLGLPDNGSGQGMLGINFHGCGIPEHILC